MTDTLTQRARDVAGRLLRRQMQQDSFGNIAGWTEPSRDATEAAAIISELVEHIEGVWQDIETAPRDGRHILVLRKDGRSVVARRFNPSSRTDVIFSIPGSWEQNATHWVPLPPPPSVLGKQEGEV